MQGHAIVFPGRHFGTPEARREDFRDASKSGTTLLVTHTLVALSGVVSALIAACLVVRVELNGDASRIEATLGGSIAAGLFLARALDANTVFDVTSRSFVKTRTLPNLVATDARVRLGIAMRRGRVRALFVSLTLSARMVNARGRGAAAVVCRYAFDALRSHHLRSLAHRHYRLRELPAVHAYRDAIGRVTPAPAVGRRFALDAHVPQTDPARLR